MAEERTEATNGDEAEAFDQPDAEEIADAISSLTPGSVLRGLRETVAHMFSEGRAEVGVARDEAWDRYNELTKHRRDNQEE